MSNGIRGIYTIPVCMKNDRLTCFDSYSSKQDLNTIETVLILIIIVMIIILVFLILINSLNLVQFWTMEICTLIEIIFEEMHNI